MKMTMIQPLEMNFSALSIQKDCLDYAHTVSVCAHCEEQMSTDNDDRKRMIHEVIACLHAPPCSNKKVTTKSTRKEFMGLLSALDLTIVNLDNMTKNGVLSKRSHIWHEMHSLSFIQVLGFAACQTASRHLDIGSAERSWSNVKMIKVESTQNWLVSCYTRGLFYTHQQSLRMLVSCILKSIPIMTLMLMYLRQWY